MRGVRGVDVWAADDSGALRRLSPSAHEEGGALGNADARGAGYGERTVACGVASGVGTVEDGA